MAPPNTKKLRSSPFTESWWILDRGFTSSPLTLLHDKNSHDENPHDENPHDENSCDENSLRFSSRVSRHWWQNLDEQSIKILAQNMVHALLHWGKVRTLNPHPQHWWLMVGDSHNRMITHFIEYAALEGIKLHIIFQDKQSQDPNIKQNQDSQDQDQDQDSQDQDFFTSAASVTDKYTLYSSVPSTSNIIKTACEEFHPHALSLRESGDLDQDVSKSQSGFQIRAGEKATIMMIGMHMDSLQPIAREQWQRACDGVRTHRSGIGSPMGYSVLMDFNADIEGDLTAISHDHRQNNSSTQASDRRKSDNKNHDHDHDSINPKNTTDAGIAWDLTIVCGVLCRQHVLYPTRAVYGDICVVSRSGYTDSDMGNTNSPPIDKTLPIDKSPRIWLNHPTWWRQFYPMPQWHDHKYRRGRVAVIGSGLMPGAARLAARGAQAMGVGSVRVICRGGDVRWFSPVLDSIVVDGHPNSAGIINAINAHQQTLVVGPGMIDDSRSLDYALVAIRAGQSVVCDASALRVIAHNRQAFIDAVRYQRQHASSYDHTSRVPPVKAPCVVMTPHAGEFAEMFPEFGHEPLIESVLKAAQLTGAFIIYKGANTIIASPTTQSLDDDPSQLSDYRDDDLFSTHSPAIVVSCDASHLLAVAGSGDVLSGCVAGLLALGMDAMYACAMAVWIHGQSARALGGNAEAVVGTLGASLNQTFCQENHANCMVFRGDWLLGTPRSLNRHHP